MDTRQDKLLQGQVDLQSQLSHFAMDNASIEIYWLSSDGRICYANKQACQTIGYSQEEFALLSLTDLDPNFPVEQWQLHWESLRRDKRQSFETQHQRKNGELFPVRVIANYVYFCGQEYNVGYAIDISARKESERILKKEADKNLALLRNASDGIHILDANGNILEASDSFCTMLGYTRDEIIGMNVSVWDAGFSTPEELKLVVQKQLKSPDRSEFGTRHRRKDGSVIDVEVSGNAFELDGEAALFNSSRDVTARKKLEFELKQHDLRFKNMFDLSPDPVLIIDGNHFIECNQAAINLLGYTKSALLNKHPSELSPEFQPDGEASFTKAERIFSTLEAKSIDRFEWVHRRADGEDFYAEVTLSLMVLDGRNVIYCVWRDITERKLTDAMIQNSISA